MATHNPICGERLLPKVLDEFVNSQPDRSYASIPRSEKDLSTGFRDVTTKQMARCVNVTAHLLQRLFGRSFDSETICYLGVPDLRGAMIFLAAVKCGHKVSSYAWFKV